jgi:tetratricopeptide (TPR) repeat protein
VGKDFLRLEKNPQAKKLYDQVIRILDKLVQEFPADQDLQRELANAHGSLAIALHVDATQSRQAVATYRKAIDIAEKLVASHPNNDEYRSELSRNYHNLAELLFETKRFQEAEQTLRQAISLLETSSSPQKAYHREILTKSYNRLGAVLASRLRSEEAEEACQTALQLAEQLAADFPSVPEYQSDLANALHHLGKLLGKRGSFSSGLSNINDTP